MAGDAHGHERGETLSQYHRYGSERLQLVAVPVRDEQVRLAQEGVELSQSSKCHDDVPRVQTCPAVSQPGRLANSCGSRSSTTVAP